MMGNLIDQTLDRFVAEFSIGKNKNQKEKRDAAFELLSCVVAFSLSPYYAKDQCWNCKVSNDGYDINNDDGKIDGFDIISNENKIKILLLQSKNSDSMSMKDIREFFQSIKMHIIDLSSTLTREFSGLEKIRDRITIEKSKYPDAIVEYSAIVSCREVNEDVKNQITSHFDNIFRLIPQVEMKFITNTDFTLKLKEIKESILHEDFLKTKTTINLSVAAEVVTYSKSEVLLAILNAKEVKKIIDNEFRTNFDLSRLFSGNVRGFLEDSIVNRYIKETIDSSRKTFLSKNNGAVIVCDNFQLQANKKEVVIINPVIVNGQQTFASIYKYANSKSKLEDIQVAIKFISIEENIEAAMIDISKASNQANSISEIDLLSNRPIMRKFGGYFIKRGKYLKMKRGDILNDVFLKDCEVVDFQEMFKIWVSVFLERPDISKTNKRLFSILIDAHKEGHLNEVMIKEENFEILAQTLFQISDIMSSNNLERLDSFFKNELYYRHAKYFILFLLKKFDFDFKAELTDDILQKVKNEVSKFIDIDKERKHENSKEYTHNNYFKSILPQTDYFQSIGEPLKKFEDSLVDLFMKEPIQQERT
jgi:hypothetical protein